MSKAYRMVVSEQTIKTAAHYLRELKNGRAPGNALYLGLEKIDLQTINEMQLIKVLFQTKRPCVFAESEINGDGTDWNLEELSILGDISVAMPVRIFDNGRHRDPAVHTPPFDGHLIFTPGALLRNDRGNVPADYPAVTTRDTIDEKKYNTLYERRLLPVFRHIHQIAAQKGRKAIVTIPGLGCGQFAGTFRGLLGNMLATAIANLLERHGGYLQNIEMMYYDPYDECKNEQFDINGVVLRVRPLNSGNEHRPQLCVPSVYEEDGDDYSNTDLYSIVAWDHVSWPGNDYYRGARATDDGVKAAATSAMSVMTGIAGCYDPATHRYLPPEPFSTWQQLVRHHGICIGEGTSIDVYGAQNM